MLGNPNQQATAGRLITKMQFYLHPTALGDQLELNPVPGFNIVKSKYSNYWLNPRENLSSFRAILFILNGGLWIDGLSGSQVSAQSLTYWDQREGGRERELQPFFQKQCHTYQRQKTGIWMLTKISSKRNLIKKNSLTSSYTTSSFCLAENCTYTKIQIHNFVEQSDFNIFIYIYIYMSGRLVYYMELFALLAHMQQGLNSAVAFHSGLDLFFSSLYSFF